MTGRLAFVKGLNSFLGKSYKENLSNTYIRTLLKNEVLNNYHLHVCHELMQEKKFSWLMALEVAVWKNFKSV